MPSKKKLLVGSFFIALTIILIFVTAQIPVAKKELKDFPILIVNEDTGSVGEQLTAGIIQTMEQLPESEKPFKFIEKNSVDEMQRLFNDSKAYGALVIPENYTEDLMSNTKNESVPPQLIAWINEGANAQAALLVRQALENIEKNMQNKQQQEGLNKLNDLPVPLNIEMVNKVLEPLPFEWKVANPTNNLESAPLSIFQPVWLASLISAVLLFLLGKNEVFASRSNQFKFRLLQFSFAILLGFTIGYGATFLTGWILGYDFSSFNTLALFISLAAMSFILMILATITWTGIGGIIIFVLLLFFGLPLLQLPPEMLPEFYTNWVLPWLPMKFLLDGLKEIFFFGNGFNNHATLILFSIFSVSAILLFLKSLIPSKGIKE